MGVFTAERNVLDRSVPVASVERSSPASGSPRPFSRLKVRRGVVVRGEYI
jgi:hypothetical protein